MDNKNDAVKTISEILTAIAIVIVIAIIIAYGIQHRVALFI